MFFDTNIKTRHTRTRVLSNIAISVPPQVVAFSVTYARFTGNRFAGDWRKRRKEIHIISQTGYFRYFSCFREAIKNYKIFGHYTGGIRDFPHKVDKGPKGAVGPHWAVEHREVTNMENLKWPQGFYVWWLKTFMIDNGLFRKF